jgi:hypothetical protein
MELATCLALAVLRRMVLSSVMGDFTVASNFPFYYCDHSDGIVE